MLFSTTILFYPSYCVTRCPRLPIGWRNKNISTREQGAYRTVGENTLSLRHMKYWSYIRIAKQTVTPAGWTRTHCWDIDPWIQGNPRLNSAENSEKINLFKGKKKVSSSGIRWRLAYLRIKWSNRKIRKKSSTKFTRLTFYL